MQINPAIIPDEILDLLARKATGVISSGQSMQLERWLHDNPEKKQECQQFFQQMQKHYWAHLSDQVDLEQAKQEIFTRQTKPRITKHSYFRWLAATAVFIGIMAIVWYLILTFQTKESAIIADQTTLERSNQAVLVLSDGREYLLGSENKTELQEKGGIHITNNPGEILAYNLDDLNLAEPVINKLKIPAGARYQLQLSDGTHVWLNAVSEIEYPVTFGNNERRIKLSGEAYFDVKSNPSSPFIIETNGYEIVVTGTSFNVTSYQHDPHMQTTLVEGNVEVTNQNGMKISLAPGQMVTFDNNGQQSYTIEKVDTRFYTSWKEGILYFNKVTLYDLSVKLGRWYDADFQFNDPEQKLLVYSGAMENSRDIRFLLDLIEQTADVQFTIEGKIVNVQ